MICFRESYRSLAVLASRFSSFCSRLLGGLLACLLLGGISGFLTLFARLLGLFTLLLSSLGLDFSLLLVGLLFDILASLLNLSGGSVLRLLFFLLLFGLLSLVLRLLCLLLALFL